MILSLNETADYLHSVPELFHMLELEFRLCPQCLDQRTKYKQHGAEVKIDWDDYNAHPLCALYNPLGFTEIRTKI